MIFPADDPVTDDPQPTALFSAAASHAVANSWTSVNGWSAARVYTSLDEEYEAAQTAVAVADFGPVIRYAARGRQAAALLARATTAPVEGLVPGESARGLMLDAGGYVVDLVETARLGEDLYLLCASRPHARRLQLAGRGFDATLEDITGHVAALAIIGPEARDTAAAAGLDSASETLARQGRVRGVETCARPIHVGALPGVEVIFPYEEALTLWERLRRARAPRPIGLDALDVIRIEGGAPRPDLDFATADRAPPASLTGREARRLPEEIGLPHLAPADSAWFNGRRALMTAPRPGRALVVLALDAGEAAPGSPVVSKKSEVGRLTSVAFSPRLRRAVAFAEIAVEAIARPLEIVSPGGQGSQGGQGGQGGGRVAATLFPTPESRLAQAFRAARRGATESRPSLV